MRASIRGRRRIPNSSSSDTKSSLQLKKLRRSERLLQHPPRSFKEPKQKHLPSAFHPFDAPDKYRVDPHNTPSKRWLSKKYWKRSVVGTNYYESLVSEVSKRNPETFGFSENTHYEYGITEVTLNHCKNIAYSLKHGDSEEQYYYLESLIFFLNSDHFDWLVQSVDETLLDAIVRLSGAAILEILRNLDDVYWSEKSNLNLLLGLAFYFLVNQALITEGGDANIGGWYLHAMEEARKHRLTIWDGLQHIEELNQWYRSVKVVEPPASNWNLEKLLTTAVEDFHSNEQGDRWDIMKLTDDQRLDLEVHAEMGLWNPYFAITSLFDPTGLWEATPELYEFASIGSLGTLTSEAEQRDDDEEEEQEQEEEEEEEEEENEEEEEDADFWEDKLTTDGLGIFGLPLDLHSTTFDLSIL